LEIRKFRAVVPGTRLAFSSERNVVLGQNASGKTALLNLISMLLRSDFSEILEESFELEYEIRFPEGNMVAHVENEVCRTAAPPTGQAGLAEQPRSQYHAKYSFTVSAGPDTYAIRGTHSDATLRHNACDIQAIPPVDLGPTGHGPFMAVLRWSVKESKSHRRPLSFIKVNSYRFDESLSAFHAMTGSRPMSVPGGPPSASFKRVRWLPQSAKAQRAQMASFSFTARYIPQNVLIGTLSEDKEKELVLGTGTLPFLERARQMFGFKDATWRADVLETKRVLQGEETEYGRFAVHFTRGDDSRIAHDLLSYGQKRLLAFLYYLDVVQDGPVVADEIVNGFHHSWIETCLGFLTERSQQAFLTSQNPLLLDYLTFKSPAEVQETFLLCRSEITEGSTLMRWEQMTKAEATRFFNEYEVGIENVGAILHRSGLW
jgi:energy-coupling factor transporter ATP-binding protein EcfA2